MVFKIYFNEHQFVKELKVAFTGTKLLMIVIYVIGTKIMKSVDLCVYNDLTSKRRHLVSQLSVEEKSCRHANFFKLVSPSLVDFKSLFINIVSLAV